MNCVINDIVRWSIKKGTRAEVVRRYLKMKYHTNIDLKSLERRFNKLQRNDNLNIA